MSNLKKNYPESTFYGTERIGKILLKIAPPVMLAQLIQALYNIVDSFFVGKYSDDALTALTVVFPIQLMLVAFSVGTGVGVNTYMARKFALNSDVDAQKAAGTGTVLAVMTWAVFAVLSAFLMRPYVTLSANVPTAVEYAVTYGKVVCIGSLGAFLEGNWTKVHQAHGNMKIPMAAQIIGAVVNIVLDPLLIFGFGFIPEMGVAGAALATVIGQIVSAVMTGIGGFRKPPKLKEMRHYAKRIYRYGYSSIMMQALYTVYIVALNIILAGFSDAAVTVLGLYYKMQSFFFIPLFGLQTCIIPILSFNYARADYSRCKRTMRDAFLICMVFMIAGIVGFILFPRQIIGLFSQNTEVHEIGRIAFPIIGTSFVSAVFSLIMPVFFQAIGKGATSLMLSLTRQIFCLLPSFWLFSLIGLNYAWLAFPVSETLAGGIGLLLYFIQVRKWDKVMVQ